MDRIDLAVGAHLEYLLTTSTSGSASIRNFARLPRTCRRPAGKAMTHRVAQDLAVAP